MIDLMTIESNYQIQNRILRNIISNLSNPKICRNTCTDPCLIIGGFRTRTKDK
ncbi:hypothetical protein CDL12_07324 [Handroanthus impetiginosus]|uniref:Uncharacterized protein n=1 Tax=Handroanthus impetiginosus TaxID=429701 RepID=A0A2G9HR55_9LAMI|nr:hypothetical protein CDL12_07324 [Handroanthus impetiginosus]